ncbi:MAG: aldehyde dehydrogenase family protein [Deltaproteobacteria bacterium]|nr:aldehyde dehydrogenase family protein [Deltaproteobacteria bacterium]
MHSVPDKQTAEVGPHIGTHKPGNLKQALAVSSKDLFRNPYDAAPDTMKIDISTRQQMLIGGNFRPPGEETYLATYNPATEELLSQIPLAGERDIDDAVMAAQRSYKKAWSGIKPGKRGEFLFRVARLLQERAREFAVLASMDEGKAIRESRDTDLPLAAAHFFYYAGWADKLEYLPGFRSPRPLGVCAQLIPWNSALLMAAWKLAPALAAGNTVVLKPSESSSLTVLRLGELIREAGLPDGVVNIITGDDSTGSNLVRHPGIQHIAFSGSRATGRELAAICGTSGQRLSLKLRGSSVHIVFRDADPDQAIEALVRALCLSQGYIYCSGSRLLIEEAFAEEFTERLKERICQLRVGNPLDQNTELGAIHSRKQLERIRALIRTGAEEGGGLWEPEIRIPDQGWFCPPAILSSVAPGHTVYRTETAGPLLPITTFRTADEAIRKAHDSPYSLAAAVWTSHPERLHYMASELRCGVIWANSNNRFDPSAPCGAYPESGWGREGGMHGLYPYLEDGQE